MACERGAFASSSAGNEDAQGSAASLQALVSRSSRLLHAYLDRTTLYLKTRWALFFLLLLLYIWRVWWLQGFFVVTYGLGIYLLNLLIGFISPQVDPETEELVLPVIHEAGEYRPFQRQLLEFKCWTAGVRAVLLSLLLTCVSAFDLPVFWPILLIYFLLLFVLTMKQQIKRMIKYRYLPFSWGKQTYGDITRSKPAAAATPPAAAATSAAPAAVVVTAATSYLKTQQQQQRNNYYYHPSATTPPPAAAAAPPSAVMTHPAKAAATAPTATAFAASEHFTTPYVLR